MPLLSAHYSPSWPLRCGHVQTIYAGLLRVVEGVHYQRERIDTPDGDFLDLDWSRVGSDRLVILSHGLEGTTQSRYVLGMTRALNRRGWDVLAWNFRGCSGEANRLPRSYHSGATDDLDTVIGHAVGGYRNTALIGFSLGGNLTLKYLGERTSFDVERRIRAAAAFSVPCDLAEGSVQLARPSNALYMRRFMASLRQKIIDKAANHPAELDTIGIHGLRTFREFDDRYTAPLHGFADAEDYWKRCSCKPVLKHLAVPALLVNAEDDPFLPPACYPFDIARDHAHLFLCTPRYGGHLGFIAKNSSGEYWSERLAATFLENALKPDWRIGESGISTAATLSPP